MLCVFLFYCVFTVFCCGLLLIRDMAGGIYNSLSTTILETEWKPFLEGQIHNLSKGSHINKRYSPTEKRALHSVSRVVAL